MNAPDEKPPFDKKLPEQTLGLRGHLPGNPEILRSFVSASQWARLTVTEPVALPPVPCSTRMTVAEWVRAMEGHSPETTHRVSFETRPMVRLSTVEAFFAQCGRGSNFFDTFARPSLREQNEQLREELAALRVKSAVALGIAADLIKASHSGRLVTDGDDLVRRARECLIYE